MSRPSLRLVFFFSSLLIVTLVFVTMSFAGDTVSGSTLIAGPTAAPTPAPVAPPWYPTATLQQAKQAAEEEEEQLGTEMVAAATNQAAVEAKQGKIEALAIPKAATLKTEVAAIAKTDGEIDVHAGRCHKELPPEVYKACTTEHTQLDNQRSGQVRTANGIIDELNGLRDQDEALEKEKEGYAKTLARLKERKVELDKRLAKLSQMLDKEASCTKAWTQCADSRCTAGMQEALKYCYSVYWDGADTGLQPLSGDLNLPFFAAPNSDGSGDGGTVDTRNVTRMTEAERAAELAKPRVQPPRGRPPSTPPPPKQ